ncbi:type IV pilus biogenesis/stability protein PilW [Shewanella gelidimarina]|uniref:type IV pilus biogenesis/stability protein PilW n=1 Tax=Shewanella gelidimarina TaxID=56813 RepID=UPI00200C59C3|nr:type IV pilus biogenesis/stability protein PilW [Shewanella gelidimarina]MCL1059034.1 type IV pilus biogenesis/stability protein PilW [Shewanella gelidimarina]
MNHRKVSVPLVILLSATALSGCVTQSTYTGTDTPVSERKVNKVAAARQRVQLGLTYLQKGNSEQAKANLDRALAFAPELEDVHIAFAYYYSSVGELEKTEQAYRQATNLWNASGDSFNNFGTFLCQQGQYAESEKMFLKAVERPLYTQSASTYENLGICSRKAGLIEKAQQYFAMALKYDPRRRTSLIELTEIELEAKRYTEARVRLSRYHKVAVESPISLALGIEIEQGLNDDEAVRKFGILLLAKFPSSPQAKQYRANTH